MVLQLFVNGCIAGCVYALVALGLSIIYNTTKIFHIAHGIVYTVAAYIFYTFAKILGLNLLLSCLIGIGSAVIMGVCIEAFIYWPFFKKKAALSVVLISSLGIYIFMVNLIAMIYGNEMKVLSSGVGKTFHLSSVIITRVQLMEVIAFVILFPVFLLLLKKTKLGWIIRALADNPRLIVVLGIDIRKVRLCIFALGSLLAGVASSLVALDVGMNPQVGISAFLGAAVAVMIGGVGSFEGVVLSAFLIGILQNLAVWQISARWTEALTFLVLILFLLFKPEGILGKKRRLEEE